MPRHDEPPKAPPWEPLLAAMDDDLPPRPESRAERLRRILSGVPQVKLAKDVRFTDEVFLAAERLAREAGDPPGAVSF